MCDEDNAIINKLIEIESPNIAPMTLGQLKDILFKKLKLNTASDAQMLSVEHLRFAGYECLTILLELINRVICDVKCLSSSPLNTAIATPIYKGKDKPQNHHKSYRMVRVQPLLSRIFDEHVRPDLIESNKKIQNENQYGFTEGISYLMAALQSQEAKSFASII